MSTRSPAATGLDATRRARTAASLVLLLAVTLVTAMAAPALAAPQDLQAPIIDDPDAPKPWVKLTVNVTCDKLGFVYDIELANAPAGEKTYHLHYRAPGSQQHQQVPSKSGGHLFQDGWVDYEVRGVVHLVGEATTYYSPWQLVTNECGDADDNPDDPDPGDGGGGGGGGGNGDGSGDGDGGISTDPGVLDEIVQASPNFTG